MGIAQSKACLTILVIISYGLNLVWNVIGKSGTTDRNSAGTVFDIF